LQENLFFQKVGPRTILVASALQRQRFQQLVLRTFYLANADPAEVAKTIQFAIPAQPGRTPTQPLVDKSTNSITVRDTTENIRIIGNLIRSLDKDRAEVVMDVQIYEVSKTDLLQFGNQIGTAASLGNLGGTTGGTVGNNEYGILQSVAVAGNTLTRVVAQPFGIGLALPVANLVALQDKQNTKLIASTQIHAFNNEDSSARIGRRVPVQSAQLLGYNNNPGNNQNNFQNNNAASVITYEQVGLTLKFKPIVFPNQDVQVAMEIESRDVGNLASLTPIFTERTIKGTARVQNNKTLLLASVAQNSESNGRTGLPLLGLIPIIGRFFTAPKRDNQQTDIVIAVTPRVIRAPAILPEDEIERPTGSLQSPTSGSLEALVIQEEIEEQLAAARRVPNVARIQLPDQQVESPAYVKSNTPPPAANNSGATVAVAENRTPTTPQNNTPQTNSIINNLRPIDVTVKTLQIAPTADRSGATLGVRENPSPSEMPKSNVLTADWQISPGLTEMKTGERVKLAVTVNSAKAFRSAVLGLKFDQRKIAVRIVTFGDVFGRLANSSAPPFLNQNGKMYVSLSSPRGLAEKSSGVLAYVEIEALADGKPDIKFDPDVLNMLTVDGENFAVKF
jgi:Flp pilus assembly secretin CpaC